jgi:hypothetical protein
MADFITQCMAVYRHLFGRKPTLPFRAILCILPSQPNQAEARPKEAGPQPNEADIERKYTQGWGKIIWLFNNIYHWSQRREEGKRIALEQNTSMTEAQINAAAKVNWYEWYIHWTWEYMTSKIHSATPAMMDDDYISDEARKLRDEYMRMRERYPSIPEAKFPWSDVDRWNISIILREGLGLAMLAEGMEGEVVIGGAEIGDGYDPPISADGALQLRAMFVGGRVWWRWLPVLGGAISGLFLAFIVPGITSRIVRAAKSGNKDAERWFDWWCISLLVVGKWWWDLLVEEATRENRAG